MSSDEVDAYLAELDEPKRSTLQELRRTILSVIPDAEEGISYGAPAFRVGGRVVAGFAAYKDHLSYLPHSGTVLSSLGSEVAGYTTSAGALQFPVDSPLPRSLVDDLVTRRLGEELPGH